MAVTVPETSARLLELAVREPAITPALFSWVSEPD